ncbi:MAG: ubiquinol-cytochrome c reductase cytochrome b subunit [Actinomycetota bacterium]|nr:ubiquinol-cytochrome c reductase cytochrome b subunit [Actinomycetota bacterium]
MSYSRTASRGALRYLDDRLGSASFLRRSMNKVFPDHWSFMLGEIALYSFIILLVTGTYISFFFEASIRPVVYDGSYIPLRGVEMTAAYESTLNLSFDVRGGLLIRQIHHWAALLFVASIVVHLMRVYFTGAFRKPREVNWVIGVGLLVLGTLEGFFGYSLPDDLLSGTGLRIGYAIVEAIPVVGTWAAFLIFGSDFPGETFIIRLYVLHILLFPGLILGLISAHMGILWHQKHTDFPGPGKTEDTVVGSRFFPTYMAKAGGFFFLVAAVMAALGGLAQINPIWLYGPYDPSNVTAGSQPDWYIGWMDGALRLMPGWETELLGVTISWNIIVPALVIPGLCFTLLAIYPFIEPLWTKDRDYHNLLERPRDNPTRTAIGAMSITFYVVLWLAGGNDIFAVTFDWSIQALIWTFRILLFVAPPVAFYVTKRICLGLQQHDEEVAHHGMETGIIHRLPSGEFIELHVPAPKKQVPALVPVEPELHEQRALPYGEPGPATKEVMARVANGNGSGNGHAAPARVPSAVGAGQQHASDATSTQSGSTRMGGSGDAGVSHSTGSHSAGSHSTNGGGSTNGGTKKPSVGRAVKNFFVAPKSNGDDKH